jgi:zinc transport system ATP-binding protein
VAAAKWPNVARFLFSLLLVGGGIWKLFALLTMPRFYVDTYGHPSTPPYAAFILGPFAANVALFVVLIAIGELAVGILATGAGRALQLAMISVMVFLLAIAPMGVGSAFPFSVFGIAAAYLVFRKLLHTTLFPDAEALFELAARAPGRTRNRTGSGCLKPMMLLPVICAAGATESVRDSQAPAVSADSAERILEVERLSVSFGGTDVLANVSFSVSRASSLAIIGPNGSGKTVLLRALLGSIPYQGSVRWALETRLGYVPQKLDLERDIPMTGHDFLNARLALARGSNLGTADALDVVGLSADVAEQAIGTMSGGQFQRLLIAFALIGQPNVLLLDEPTAGVDESGQEQINRLLHRLQQDQRLTILFISHDLSVVYQYADQVLCLSRKRPYVGAPRQILTPDVLEEIYGMRLGYHIHDA